MKPASNEPLHFTTGVLKFLVVLNIGYGLFILVMYAISVVSPDWFFPAIGIKGGRGAPFRQGLRMVMVGGMIGVPLAHLILRRLIAIVRTVGDGDPFIAENAERLRTIAWLVLALQLLQRGIAWAAINAAELDLDLKFSIAPWLAILLLFVLAKVFEQGARMRADLQGTV